MRYFIEAAEKIMDEEGLDKVTIRKVSDLAGYNSATLYNYFTNRDHLVCFLAIARLKGYIKELQAHQDQANNVLEEFFLLCHYFSTYAFKNASLCMYLYEKPFDTMHYFNEYYFVFPQELKNVPERLRKTISGDDYMERNRIYIAKCIQEGYFREEDIDDIVMVENFLFEGMLRWVKQLENEKVDYVQAVLKYDKYIADMLSTYFTGDKRILEEAKINFKRIVQSR